MNLLRRRGPAEHDRGTGTYRTQVRPTAGGWWRAWRGRFGLAEVCCNSGAAAGVVAGYLSTGSLFAAAALAMAGGTSGFYGCVGVKTAVAASRVTAHLAGWCRLAAAAWHAVTQQLASCAAAEALDDLLIRPGCLAVGWWLLRPLPGGVWLGFAVGKAAADVAWYGMEACARRGVAAFIKGRQPTTPCLPLDVPRPGNCRSLGYRRDWPRRAAVRNALTPPGNVTFVR
jgi:hypothetical protein